MKSFSWRILSKKSLVKYLDYSCFKEHGTGIPKNILPEFIKSKKIHSSATPIDISLVHEQKTYNAKVKFDKSGRAKLKWDPIFTSILTKYFSDWQIIFPPHKKCSEIGCPYISFNRVLNTSYNITISKNQLLTEPNVVPTLMENIIPIEKEEPSNAQESKAVYSTNAKRIGDRGERLVINYLRQQGMKNILWVAQIGETPGYDICYTDLDSNEVCLEVKATQAQSFSSFIITKNEFHAAKELKDQYKLAFVTEVMGASPKIQIIENPFLLNNKVDIAPLSYQVKFKN